MDVTLNETGDNIHPLGINDLCFIADGVFDVTDGSDAIACHGPAARIDLAGVHVDDLSVGDNQISFLLAACHCQKVLIHCCLLVAVMPVSEPVSRSPETSMVVRL